MWKTKPPYHMNREQASLRIFAEADEVTRLLAKEIKLQVQLAPSALSLHLKTFKHMFAIQNSDHQWEKQTTLSSQCQKSWKKLQRSMPWSHMMSVGKKVKEINNLSILLSSSFHNVYHHYQCNVLGFHLMDRTDKCVCLFYMLWCIHLMCERQIYLKLVGVFVAIHF